MFTKLAYGKKALPKNWKVIKITHKNGVIRYEIEYKMWFGLWRRHSRMVGMDTSERFSFETEKEAKNHIKENVVFAQCQLDSRIESQEEITF